MANRLQTSGCLLVSFDFSNGRDHDVVLVGEKQPKKDVTIVNAFRGKEAREIYEKLTTVRKKGTDDGKIGN